MGLQGKHASLHPYGYLADPELSPGTAVNVETLKTIQAL